MISEIIQPEKRDVSDKFDLPVMVVHTVDPESIVVLTEFIQDDDNNFWYNGYYLQPGYLFQPVTIYDNQIKDWSKFKGKVVLSNFAENE